MGHGANPVYIVTMASGGTLTSQIDLSRAWNTVYLVVASMNSNTQLHIQGSDSNGGTFRRLYHPTLNSSTVGTNVFAIASAMSNGIVPIPNSVRFLKVESTATVDDGCTYKMICGD